MQKLTKTKDVGKATLQANVKTLNWRKVWGQRSPVWEDNADSKIYRQWSKIGVPEMGYCSRGQRMSWCTQNHIGYYHCSRMSTKTRYEIIILHSWRYFDCREKPSWKPPSWWLGFMVPEGSIQPAGVEKAAAPLPHCVLIYNLISQQDMPACVTTAWLLYR